MVAYLHWFVLWSQVSSGLVYKIGMVEEVTSNNWQDTGILLCSVVAWPFGGSGVVPFGGAGVGRPWREANKWLITHLFIRE